MDAQEEEVALVRPELLGRGQTHECAQSDGSCCRRPASENGIGSVTETALVLGVSMGDRRALSGHVATVR